MILITGATGHLGRAAINFLLTNTPAVQIAGLVRNREKGEAWKTNGVDVRVGDYTNYDSLVEAFRGVDTLGFVSSSEFKDRVKQHTNVIEAAKEAGVRHIVYTSFLHPQPGGKFLPGADHIATEEHLKNSGLTYTVLRNTFYMDIFPWLVDVNRVLESGQLAYPAGGGKLTLASRTDMAEALAAVLTGSGHEDTIYEISSAKAYSFDDIARLLSDLSGKPVQHVDIPLDAYRQGMTQLNLPPEAAGFAVMMAETIRNGEADYPDNALAQLIGHKPLSLEEYVRQTYFSPGEQIA